VGVEVTVSVSVTVAVTVGVKVSVGVGVKVTVLVTVGVWVMVGVKVTVSVGVVVLVNWGVKVTVGAEGVVGDEPPQPNPASTMPDRTRTNKPQTRTNFFKGRSPASDEGKGRLVEGRPNCNQAGGKENHKPEMLPAHKKGEIQGARKDAKTQR
jgi:hypothetical protein